MLNGASPLWCPRCSCQIVKFTGNILKGCFLELTEYAEMKKEVEKEK